MISINRDYDDVPSVLSSEKTREAVNRLLKDGELIGIPQLDILMHPEVIGKLLEVYHNKCAICETKISRENSSAYIMHYRPPKLYHWLTYEWSNLLPVCEECKTNRTDDFPVFDENKRVKTVPLNRRDFRADSALMRSEDPLIIHPELDTPERYIGIDNMGSTFALNENSRASYTIETFGLNSGHQHISRRYRIRSFFSSLRRRADIFIQSSKEDLVKDEENYRFFLELFSQIKLWIMPQAEYSLLGQYMFKEFEDFFLNKTGLTPKATAVIRSAYTNWLSHEKELSVAVKSSGKKKEQRFDFVLEGLDIENIKCFSKLKVDFPDPEISENTMLLIGGNGTGKSTFLQLLALGLKGLYKPPVYYGWTDVLKENDRKGTFRISFRFRGQKQHFDFSIDKNDVITCLTNRSYFESVSQKLLVLAYGTGQGQPDTMNKRRFKEFESIASAFGDNSYLKSLEHSQVYAYVNESFEDIKLIVNQILSDPDPDFNIKLSHYNGRAFFFETPTGTTLLQSMSDGFQTVFSWIFDMLIRMIERGINIRETDKVRGVVLIDEIDMHLNIGRQQTILPALESLFPNVQFFIATQSPFIIQSMRHNNVKIFTFENREAHVKDFFSGGKPWGRTINEITSAMLGQVTEISVEMNKKLRELSLAVDEKRDEDVRRIYWEIRGALPSQSKFRAYIDEMTEAYQTTKTT